MSLPPLNRRLFILGSAASLSGCSTIAALEDASVPLNTYDLTPVTGAPGGSRSRVTLLVLEPETPAALASDRILIRPTPQSVAYLPDARWVDNFPLLLQSLLIRSLAATDRVGFVGAVGSGPVPDIVLLTRVDRFDLSVPAPDAMSIAQIDFTLTLLRDIDQQIIGSQQFATSQAVPNDTPQAAVATYQQMLAGVFPGAIDWALDRAV